MVSNVNLSNAIGRHLAIYPVKSEDNPNAFDLNLHIEGASFDFTASQYAWSVGDKKSAIKNGRICIKPHDTVIIFTNEAISLDGYYAGACYCKLTFSMQGITHSSSPLKPGYTGRLSVSLHNDSEEEFWVNIGSSIVVIMLHRLRKPANITRGNGRGARTDILAALNIGITGEERIELQKYDNRQVVMDSMKETKNYIDYKRRIFRKKSLLCKG